MLKLNLKKLIFLILIFLFCSAIILPLPPVYRLKEGSITVYSPEESSSPIKEFSRNSPTWLSHQDVSKHFIHAVIAAEDARFYKHWGIDLAEIFASLSDNIQAHRIVRGASTITQQVVRLAFLNQERSYMRKYREILGAVFLEFFLNKEEILEWYLNLVYFGNGSQGLDAASKRYFATTPDMLTLNQSIYLALLLPSPSRSAHVLTNKRLDKIEKNRFIHILNQMQLNGFITEQEKKQASLTGDFGRPLGKIEEDPEILKDTDDTF